MMTGDVNSVFLDTNILIYASIGSSPFHQAAVNRIQEFSNSGVKLWISRQILREYIAALTRPQGFANPQPVTTLIEDVRYFQNRFRVAEDSFEVTEQLLRLLAEIPTGGRQVHDANIVATMQVYGVGQLLTGNLADFARFSELVVLLPLNDEI